MVGVLLLFVGEVLGEGSERALKERIQGRTFPSVFQAWNKADNLKGEDEWKTLTRHDLVFHSAEFFWLKWEGKYQGLSRTFEKKSVGYANGLRDRLMKMNPNLVMLGELRYRDAHESHLPKDHAWWKRDKNGKRVVGWAEGGYYLLDFGNADYREHIAKKAKAMVASGVFDGVMLDWWHEYGDKDALAARLDLLKRIRKAIGEDALILVNSNHHKVPKSAKYVNGLFMECWESAKPENWKLMSETLLWANKTLREPRINAIEAWYQKSRKDYHMMRAVTTMSLTHGEGYCLFSDPNPLPTPDHLHDWYPFWERSLGKGVKRGVMRKDGAWERAFEKGIVVYNPYGNQAVKVKFDGDYRRASNGKVGKVHEVKAWDGEIFLKVD